MWHALTPLVISRSSNASSSQPHATLTWSADVHTITPSHVTSRSSHTHRHRSIAYHTLTLIITCTHAVACDLMLKPRIAIAASCHTLTLIVTCTHTVAYDLTLQPHASSLQPHATLSPLIVTCTLAPSHVTSRSTHMHHHRSLIPHTHLIVTCTRHMHSRRRL